jgi:hypothetical protein
LIDIKPPDNCVAGRTKDFHSNWKLITSDPWILATVQGYKIPFIYQPLQWRPKHTKARTEEEVKSIKDALSELTMKGAIKIVHEQPNQFTSTLFIMKQNKKNRPIFNLKNLNRYVETQKFKMEGLDSVRKLLQRNDFMMKLDLTDAYFTVPIHDNHKKYLRLIFQGCTYEFQCLPFGLSSAPQTFTKLLKPVIALIRSQAIWNVIYPDDMLLMDQNPERLISVFHNIVNLLQSLGFLIKREKCSPSPTQGIEFLGAVINSKDMTIAVPNTKLLNLQAECKKIHAKRCVTLKELSVLLGRMNHCAQVGMAQGPLHYRVLQQQHITSVKKYGHKAQIPLNRGSLDDLLWWMSPEIHQFNKSPLNLPPFDMVIHTDASTQGWGAHCQGVLTGGRWNSQEACHHINILELEAALLAIKSFLPSQPRTPQHIRLLMDNSTAVAYVNRRGGTRSSMLAKLALEIWTVCHKNAIWITAEHLPGSKNVDADWASRHFNERIEWTLDKNIFTKIGEKYYIPQIDLFASRLNHQLPKYVARYPDPDAVATDAMTLQWNSWT